jgi:FAD/FMN-containing dehydrogenase
MRFRDLILKIARGDESAATVSLDEILFALDESFPRERRAQFSAQRVEFVETPPADIPGIDFRNGAFHPTTVDQVQQIVNYARQHFRRVRSAGAQHSTPGAIFSPSRQDLRVILAGSLRKVEFLSEDATGATVKVGAGCYLGVNPSDPSSNRRNSLNAILDARGYALPILGGISHQTVAGFLQTSSAGGSLDHGFADCVQAIELVDGNGDVRWLNIGSEAFYAAGIAVGLFGVVTHLVLSVKPRYFVAGVERNQKEKDSLLHKSRGHYPIQDALGSTEFLHLNWFPQDQVHRVTEWKAVHGDPIDPPDPYDSELKSLLMNVLAAFILLITSGELAIDPRGPHARRVVAFFLKLFVSLDRNETFNAPWLDVLPCDDAARVDTLIKVIFTEIWLPLDQVTPALDRLKVITADPVVAGNFAIEFYGAKQSPFWLSPSFDRDVFRVDVFWWAYSFGDPRKHFEHFWNALLELPGARLHWGKHLPDVGTQYGGVVFNLDFLKHQYGNLARWLQIRRAMDPDGVFVTEYWRRIFEL